MSFGEIMSMIGTIVLMVAVFVGAYYVSKYVGKHYQPRTGSSSNISIIESKTLGKDRSLLVVKSAGKAFLIGATPREIALISELDAEKLVPPAAEKPVTRDFSAMFRSALSAKGRKDEGEDS